MKIKQANQIPFQIIDGLAVVVVPKERTQNLLNETGTAIWNFIQSERTEEDIIDFVCENYDIDRETAKKDTKEFINKLINQKLLEIIQ